MCDEHIEQHTCSALHILQYTHAKIEHIDGNIDASKMRTLLVLVLLLLLNRLNFCSFVFAFVFFYYINLLVDFFLFLDFSVVFVVRFGDEFCC